MRDVDEYLGPPPDISPLPDGTTPEVFFPIFALIIVLFFKLDSRKY